MSKQPVSIQAFAEEHFTALQAHIARHRQESPQQGYFMPFARDEKTVSTPVSLQRAQLPLTSAGWRRWFLAIDPVTDQVVGHCNLDGAGLPAAMHRCELGIGIELAWRGAGLGTRLMQTAIDFARRQPDLVWLDLRVFAHNTDARHLYQKMGFEELRTVPDQFRVDELVVDEVLMTLRVD